MSKGQKYVFRSEASACEECVSHDGETYDSYDEISEHPNCRCWLEPVEEEEGDNPDLSTQEDDFIQSVLDAGQTTDPMILEDTADLDDPIGGKIEWTESAEDKIASDKKENKMTVIQEGKAKEVEISEKTKLVFDGEKLTAYENGKPMQSWWSISGREGFQDPIYQGEKNKGPLPTGQYVAQQTRHQSISNISALERAKGFLGRGTWRGLEKSWGNYRVWLDPSEDSNMKGRSNFSIHGGYDPGSAGCIDLVGSMDDFSEWFRSQGENLLVEVWY